MKLTPSCVNCRLQTTLSADSKSTASIESGKTPTKTTETPKESAEIAELRKKIEVLLKKAAEVRHRATCTSYELHSALNRSRGTQCSTTWKFLVRESLWMIAGHHTVQGVGVRFLQQPGLTLLGMPLLPSGALLLLQLCACVD